MKTWNKIFAVGLGTLSLSMSSLVFAQAMPAMQMLDRTKMMEKMQQRMEKHQNDLHDKLKLNASQENAWKTFVIAIKPVAPPEPPSEQERKAHAQLNTPARLDKMLEKMKEHEARFVTRANAVKAFYAVLTPEQQKTFDSAHRVMQKQMEEGSRPKREMGEHDHPDMDKPAK